MLTSALFRFSLFFFPFSFCSTGLVRLDIASLPLRSCQTIGAPSVQGSAQCLFYSFMAAAGFETHILVITMRTSYRCATLTPHTPPYVRYPFSRHLFHCCQETLPAVTSRYQHCHEIDHLHWVQNHATHTDKH